MSAPASPTSLSNVDRPSGVSMSVSVSVCCVCVVCLRVHVCDFIQYIPFYGARGGEGARCCRALCGHDQSRGIKLVDFMRFL